MKYKYLLKIEDKIDNCGCESGYIYLKCFMTIKDIMNFLLTNHYIEIDDVLNLKELQKNGYGDSFSNKLCFSRYGKGWHGTQLDFYKAHIKNREYRTRDNGKGQLEWYRYK